MRETEAIRQAVAAFAADTSQDNLYQVLESLRQAAEQGTTVYVPVDGSGEPATVSRPEGTRARVLYTDAEEGKAAGEKVVGMDVKSLFLAAAAERDPRVSGVLIDPEGTRMFLPTAMIQTMLLEQQTQENEIYFEIGDITELDCDCIVNAANDALVRGGGVCGAIFRAAGWELDEACDEIGGCPTGEARITPGFGLKVPYIIHAVGPIYSGSAEDAKLLASCYRNSLDLAAEHGIHSIAFPAISTGIYGYPAEEACEIALKAVSLWLADHVSYGMAVIFSCFDQKMFDTYDRVALKLEGKTEND